MRTAHLVADVRAAENAVLGAAPGDALMQAAATGLAITCLRLLGGAYGRRVVVLAGGGNNGGDALWAGALLARRGARVDAVLLAESAHAEGLAALRGAGGRVVPATSAQDPVRGLLHSADLIVDGIIGIGGRGALRGVAAELATAACQAPGLTVAVDVPSGVDADTGEVAGGAVRAAVTVTFGTLKPGLLAAPGALYAGTVELVDIGLRPHLPPAAVEALQDADVAGLLPEASPTADKYRRGVVGVVAGSDAYPGASVLTVSAALRTGAGMVRFVSSPRAAAAVRTAAAEAVVTELNGTGDPRAEALGAGRVQAWAIGPGLGTDEHAAALVRAVLSADVPVVADADALTVLADAGEGLDGRTAATLLTPHAGELARMTGTPREEIEAAPLRHAQEAAARFGAVVLLKGPTTVVAAPEGRARVNPTGTPLLATAGSGDVLTGCAGALLSAGLDAYDAGSVAAYLHGRAARSARAGGPVTAGDVAGALPATWAAIAGLASTTGC